MTQTRKLAAILVSDVVGYSRLTGADEDRILARLRTLRSDLIDPTIAVHHGRVVKRTGDGAIVEFRSVVDAVNCAIEIQRAMVERNAEVAPDKRIEFRVGIHLGDVVEEADGDLMGDGVNIAARLESVAKPGSICLSEDAYRQVKQRLELKVKDLGATPLKNIAQPVHAYLLDVGVPVESRAALERGPTLATRKASGLVVRWAALALAVALVALAAIAYAWHSGLAWRMIAAPSPPHLSVVVLPFTNLSSDPEQDYFADAITDDLTTDLSHLSDSFVIARNTAFTYKGKPVDVKGIGKELGVRYALEGSVRRLEEVITINAQLISTETGAHVWAERFEGERAKLGELQVDIVARLANALRVELVRAEALRASRERPDNPDAVDLSMRGQVAEFRFNPAGYKEAIDDYERALKLDPDLVRAKIGLSGALTEGVLFGFSADPPADALRAEKLADEALSAEPGNAYAHYVKAEVYQPLIITGLRRPPQPQWEAGIAEAETAISIDQNLAPAHTISGYWRVFLGRAAEGLAGVETAIRLGPHSPGRPIWEFQLCHLHSHLAQWEKAIEHCRLAIQGAPNFWYSYADVAAGSAWLGRDAEAKAAVADLLRLKPGYTAKAYLDGAPAFSDNAVFIQQVAQIAEGMRKAGLPWGEAKTN
jgi:class 3 adenylate cyclase/TolB-like protein